MWGGVGEEEKNQRGEGRRRKKEGLKQLGEGGGTLNRERERRGKNGDGRRE